MKPLVSIIIPCYNHEKFLPDCLESILKQTYENIELLICDDCSPDASWDVIMEYAPRLKARFSRIELLQNLTNYGVTKNVNRMLCMAKGEFVKIIASDDAMTPSAIGEMTAFLLNNTQIDVVVSNGVKVSEEQHYPGFDAVERLYPSPPDFHGRDFFLRVARCNPISAPAAMVRMSVYNTYGLYDENVKVEDYEFWLRILHHGNAHFAFLDSDLLYYRISANSMTSLSANAGLAQRRRRIHDSELGTLQKFRHAISKRDYAQIVLDRMSSELWLAVQYRLTEWEQELIQRWKTFDGWKDLPGTDWLKYRFFAVKQYVKKCLLRRG